MCNYVLYNKLPISHVSVILIAFNLLNSDYVELGNGFMSHFVVTEFDHWLCNYLIIVVSIIIVKYIISVKLIVIEMLF